MVKTYKYNRLYTAALYLIFIVSIYGAYDIGKTYGFIFGFIIFISFGWLVFISASLKIMITNQCLVEEAGSLAKRVECEWDQVVRISRIPIVFLWTYKIHLRAKPPITISNMITDYQDLLKEIVARAPQAIVDDSIKKMLENRQIE